MSSISTRDAIPSDAASARLPRILRALAPAALVLRLLSAPAPAGASATLPEMARLEAADRLDRIQVDRLGRWYGTLGLAREAAEFVERRVRAGDLSGEEAVPIFERIVRDAGGFADVDALMAACDASMRNGNAGSAIFYPCAEGFRREGRLDKAMALLSRIERTDPYFPFARYAAGQIAVARGDLAGALAIFREIEAGGADGSTVTVAARASAAEADLLSMTGSPRESSRDGSLAARKAREGKGAARPAVRPNAPPAERVREWIRAGDAAAAAADFQEAVGAYRRSMEESNAILAAGIPSDIAVARAMEGPPRTFRLLVDAHEAAGSAIAPEAVEGPSPPSHEIRNLLADLLCLGFFMDRAAGSFPSFPSSARTRFLSPERRGLIFRAIEKNTLGGMEVDGILANSAGAIDVFENLAHPIRRYRSLAGLESRQAAMTTLADRAGKSREALVAALESFRGTDLLPVLRNLDAYLRDLDAVRATWDETRDLVRQQFDIFPRERGGEGEGGEAAAVARDGVALDGQGVAQLRRFARDLEEGARSVARDSEGREIRDLRSATARRYVEALVLQARLLEKERAKEWEAPFWRALAEGASILGTEAFDTEFRLQSAVRIGSLAAGRLPRWERFPETAPAGPEADVIRKVLPMLECAPGGCGSDGGALWVSAVLRWRVGDPGAGDAAREFLARYPASPMAGQVALRLGHDALRARRWREARDAYRNASGHGPADVAASARFMLGWLAHKDGDAARALRELSAALAALPATGSRPAALEDDVVSLAVRCWLDVPGERLLAYAPIRERTQAGKRIMAGLAEAESRRGRMARAAELFSAIATAYPGDGDGLIYELRSIESLARGGMEREALSRALDLARRGGPHGGDKTTLARLLRDLSVRRFAEGTRSGRADAMADAAAGISGYFELMGPGPRDGDAELRLTWAAACLRSGDRAAGLRILEDIRSVGTPGSVAERAALLHSDASIAGLAGGEVPAARAEESIQFLFRHFPGEKSTVLGMRAAMAFLDSGDPARAARAADAVAGSATGTPGMRAEATLLHARALLVSRDFSGARLKAAQLLGAPPGANDSEVRTHARDVLVLAARKEAEAKAAAGDRIAAAAVLEEVAARFPELPDAADRMLDALSYYRDASDAEASLRTGSAFLRLFPGRIESLDVAAAIGPLLEERGRGAEAATLYARVSDLFPRDERSRRFLFRAARVAEKEGDRDGAERWYAGYARRYREPGGAAADAVLSAALLGWRRENSPEAIRAVEKGLRLAESAMAAEARPELSERVDRARIAVGDYWAGRFRQIPLVDPLDRSLARKQRCFRTALAAYEAASRSASIDARLAASRSSGDLFLDFGRAILESQRPRGMDAGERELYESALSARSRTYVERALDDYSAALERMKEDGMPASLAEPIRQRMAVAGRMLGTPPEAGVRK